MPPHLLNTQLRQVRQMVGWRDPVTQIATGQTIGAWLALTEVNANLKFVVAASLKPNVRVEGRRAFLRGSYEVTAEIVEGTKLFKIPPTCRPAAGVGMATAVFVLAGATTTRLLVSSGGVANAAMTLKKGNTLYLDGVSWSLN